MNSGRPANICADPVRIKLVNRALFHQALLRLPDFALSLDMLYLVSNSPKRL